MKHQGWYRSKFMAITKKIKVRKLLLYISLIILMLLPIQLAKFSQYKAQNQSNYLSISLYQQDGALISSEEGTVESAARYSLIDYFYNIYVNKKEVSNAPGDPSSDPYVTAWINLNGSLSRMKCFFSLDGTSDYLIDENEKIYTVSSLYTKNFVTSPYAASFYPTATPPLLFSINNDTITPYAINWNYKNIDEKFVSATVAQTTSEQRSYDITGEIGLYFETPPTQCSVTVYDKGMLIFQGDINQLATLPVNTKSELNVKMTAVWKQNTVSPFFGTVQYDFLVRIQTPSTFSITSNTVSPGEWVFLSGTNISDPSKVSFRADWCKAPLFCKNGSMTYALIPIPLDITANSLEFEVSHGASKQTFQIALQSPPLNEPHLQASNVLSPNLLNEEIFTEYQFLIDSASQSIQSNFLFRDSFESPLSANFSIGYQQGDLIRCDTDTVFKLIGTEFVTSASNPQPVLAWNHGKVVQVASSTALGNYVVVEHGCGIQIWYCHLTQASVTVGDIVSKGQSIGLTGTDGIATGNGYLVICTINQTIVNPQSIMGQTILKNK